MPADSVSGESLQMVAFSLCSHMAPPWCMHPVGGPYKDVNPLMTSPNPNYVLKTLTPNTLWRLQLLSLGGHNSVNSSRTHYLQPGYCSHSLAPKTPRGKAIYSTDTHPATATGEEVPPLESPVFLFQGRVHPEWAGREGWVVLRTPTSSG